MTKNSKIVTSIVVLIVVIAAIGGFVAVSTKNNAADTTGGTTSTPLETITTSTTTTADIPKTSKYRDGTYAATGKYNSPGGPDQLGVSLTIKNDIVTDANVTNIAGDRESSQYQDMFITGYKAQVIGKNIDSIDLTRVSGSSLTPRGFNDALSQIKTQAKA